MARKKNRATARNGGAGQPRANCSAPGPASDIPTSNMRETSRVTRSSTAAPIPAARNTTSSQPSRPPPTKSRMSSAKKSAERLLRRIKAPTADYMTGGNPGVFDCLYPPRPGTVEDEELDDDLNLMGILPDGPSAPPAPRRPRVPARDPGVPDCDNLPVSNVRADPLNEEMENLDRILAMMPDVDADDVDPARMMANMRSAAQKQNAMERLVTHDKNVEHQSRPELSEAMKKHEVEVALAKHSHQRNMAGMDNYLRNPDIVNRNVFGSAPTRTQDAEQHFTAEEPAQRKKKKPAKTTASQKDGKSKQNKGKAPQRPAPAIEVISSESDSTSTTSLPGSSPGLSSPQPDTTNLNMLAQAAELLIGPAGTQHHDEVTVQDPVQHRSSTETTAQQNDPQAVQEEETTIATANEEEQAEESQSTSAFPHATDPQHVIHQPGPTNLDILAQVAALRSPLIDPVAYLQKPATTLSRPIAAVSKTGSTSNSQAATKLPTVEAMTTAEPVPINTNVEPTALTGSNTPDNTTSSRSSDSITVNLRYKTVKFIPPLLSSGPPAPSTGGSGKRKQPTEVTTTDEPAAKKSRRAPIATTASDWTPIQYDPEAEQRKRNKNKTAQQPAPSPSASDPPSTADTNPISAILGKRKTADTSSAAPPSSPTSPNPKRRRVHPTPQDAPTPAEVSTVLDLLARRGASIAAPAPSLPAPPSSTHPPSNQPANPTPIPAAIQAEYDRIQAGTAAPFAAPTGGLRTATSPLPICGANGFRLLHAQPQCVVNQPPPDGRVVLYYINARAAGIQTLAYGGRGDNRAKAVDWTSAADVARVRRWVLQKLQRWGCDRVRADMKERAWLEEEDEVLRVEGRRLAGALPGKTKTEYARELTRILKERFGGREMEGTIGGKRQGRCVRPVRTVEGTSTRCDRLDQGMFWVNLGVDEEKAEKVVAKEGDESEDVDEEGQSPAVAKKGKKCLVKPETGGKGKGAKK